MSIRAAARAAGVPAATVQGWLSGRYFPTPALRGEFSALVGTLGLSDRLVPALWDAEPPASTVVRTPYLGLSSYRENDADLFFGRDAESARLAGAIREAESARLPVVVVVGGSGCGKTSLLASGLTGRECLESGVLEGWRTRFIQLSQIGNQTLQPRDATSEVWIVDQVEDELALGATVPATDIAHLPEHTVLVLAVRADSFGALTDEPVLADAVSRPFVVTPMSVEDVRQVIAGPSERVGLQVDRALIEMIIRDAGITSEGAALPSGALPLLSNALLVTWQSRPVGKPMTMEDYRAQGGLPGSINTLAERVFRDLPTGDAELARATLLALVRVGPTTVQRRSVPLKHLSGEQRNVLEPFLKARLVSVVNASDVEISHDALLTNWSRLAEWIEEGEDRLRRLDLVRQAANAWDSNARVSELLLPISKVPGISEFASPAQAAPLTTMEREFLSRSSEHFEAQLAQERQQIARLRRQRGWILALLASAVALAIVASSLAVHNRRIQFAAESRQVAAASDSLRTDDPNLRAQMALVSDSLSSTLEGRSALLESTAVDVPTRWLGVGSATVAASPDGQTVVRGDGTGHITVWHGSGLTRSAGTTVAVDPSAQQIYSVSVAVVDGRTLAAIGGISVAAIWDVTTTPHLVSTVPSTGTILSTAISGASRLAAFGGGKSTTILSLGTTVSAVATVQGPTNAVAVAGDGTVYVAGQSTVTAWQKSDGGTHRTITLADPADVNGWRLQTLALTRNDKILAGGYNGARVVVWNVAHSGPLQQLTVGSDWVNGVAFSADDKLLAVSGSDQHTYVLDTSDWAQERSLADPSKLTSVAWSGTNLVTGGVDGTLRVWTAQSPLLLNSGTAIWQLTSNAGGTKWLATSTGGKVYLWKVTHDGITQMPSPTIPAGLRTTSASAISPDGQWLSAGTHTGKLITWELGPRGAGTPRTDQVLPTGVIGSLAYDPTSKVIAATSNLATTTAVAQRQPDGSWHTTALVPSPNPQTATFDPDRSVLEIGLGAMELVMWDVSDPIHPKQLSTITTDATPSGQAPGPNHMLAVGSDTGTVTVWDTTDPSKPVLKQTHNDASSPVYGLAFDPSGSTLVAATGDGMLWGWSLATRDTLYALDDGPGESHDVRFVDNGRLLIAAGETGTVRSWDHDAIAARQALCERIGDPLTAAEMSRYLPGISSGNPCPV